MMSVWLGPPGCSLPLGERAGREPGDSDSLIAGDEGSLWWGHKSSCSCSYRQGSAARVRGESQGGDNLGVALKF